MAKVLQDSSTVGSSKACPVCNGSGHTTAGTLSLRQINATEAIYVCNNPECFYPVGGEVITVKRDVPELMSGQEQAKVMGSGDGPSTVNSEPARVKTSSGEEITSIFEPVTLLLDGRLWKRVTIEPSMYAYVRTYPW
jgi:hypothetical protein